MKFIKSLIVTLLGIITLLPMINTVAVAGGSCYVFSTMTEYDPGSKIAVSTSNFSVVSFGMQNVGYLYTDMGSSYYSGDFLFQTSINVTSQSASGQAGAIMNLMNDEPDSSFIMYDEVNNSVAYDYIGIRTHAHNSDTSLFYLFLWERRSEDTSGYQSSNTDYLDVNTEYYLDYYRDVSAGTYGTLYLDVYSDEARTTLVDSISLALHENNNWQYFVPFLGWGHTPSGYQQTYEVGQTCYWPSTSTGSPEVETNNYPTVTYLPDSIQYKARVTGNVTDNGTGTLVTYFYYSYDESTWYSTLGWTDDGYTYMGDIYSPLAYKSQTVYYYFYGITPYGSDNGTEYSYILESSNATVPTVSTIDTEISKLISPLGSNTTVYGTIFDDGGSNCTGFFYYKAVGAGSWLTSSNTTGLQSDDGFNATLTGLSQGIPYEFRASATNDVGSANGTIYYFTWYEYTTPEVTTLSPTGVDSNSVILNGYVNDGGGGAIKVGFDWRKQGTTTWNRIDGLNGYSTGSNFTQTLSGLSSMTNYEYRALVTNDGLYDIGTDTYTYITGDTVGFTTLDTVNVPTLTLDDVGYWDNYTVVCTITLVSDGGNDCTINMQYRQSGQSWQNSSTAGVSGAVTGDEITTYIGGLDYGTTYEFRAFATNPVMIGDDYLGGTGYSNVISYQLLSDTDTTTGSDTGTRAAIDKLLGNWGWNNSGGHALFIVICCVFAFLIIVLIPGRNYQDMAKFTVPIGSAVAGIIVMFGMIIGYLPAIVTGIIVVLFAGMAAVFVTKIFTGSRGNIE